MTSTIVEKYQRLRQDLKDLQTKQIQFELDLQQHERVLETIVGLDEKRKCYRLVGEVLVQTTIGEARPALEAQRDSLKDLFETFSQKIELKDKEIQQYQTDNKIQFRPISEFQENQEKNN